MKTTHMSLAEIKEVSEIASNQKFEVKIETGKDDFYSQEDIRVHMRMDLVSSERNIFIKKDAEC